MPRVEVSPGFLVVLGALFWLDEGVGLLPWGLLACFFHELGHVVAATVCGGHVRSLSLTVVGAELRMDYDVPLRYGQDSLVALAGPGANLLFGLLALGLDWELAAVVSLTIGAFNLLPIPPLDGSKVLFSLLPDRAYYTLMRFERFGMLVLLLIIWLDLGGSYLSDAIRTVYYWMAELFFSFERAG